MTPQINMRTRWQVLLGVALIVAGIFGCWKASGRGGYDLGPLYVMSIALLHGQNVYAPDVQTDLFLRYANSGLREMAYPPATAFVMMPLAAFPYATACILWLGILIASVMGGVCALLRACAPQSRCGHYLIACGLALLCAGTRWCMTPLQGAPLILLLLGLFVLALKTQKTQKTQNPQNNRNTRALFALAVLALSFKPTLALPFLILLLAQRRFTLVGGILAAVAALNVAGFWRMGGVSAIRDYRISVTNFELAPINAPDPHVVTSLYRCDWVRLGVGLTRNLTTGHHIATGLTLLTLLYLVYIGWRMGEKASTYEGTMAFFAPSVCFTLLCVYHQHYDMLLLLAPFLLYLCGPDAERKSPDTKLFLGLAFLFVGFYPLAQAHHLLLQAFGDKGVVAARMMVPILTTLLLVASLFVLHRETNRKQTALA